MMMMMMMIFLHYLGRMPTPDDESLYLWLSVFVSACRVCKVFWLIVGIMCGLYLGGEWSPEAGKCCEPSYKNQTQ